MPLSEEHKQKMLAGRKAYLDKLRAQKNLRQPANHSARAMDEAVTAQGGSPVRSSLSRVKAYRSRPKGKAKKVHVNGKPDFAAMTLEELRKWVTLAKTQWDDAISALKQKEGEWSANHNSVDCACGCGLKIDLSRGRFASSESYYDDLHQVKTRYWASQRCVQAYRLAQSPQYKDQVRREIEEKLQRENEMPTASGALEG